MHKRKSYFVYVMGSLSGTLYIGVTSRPEQRIHEHKQGTVKGFTSKYNVDRLLYWESYDDVRNAIDREKKLKGWRRNRKIELLESLNPHWLDLSNQNWSLQTSPPLPLHEHSKTNPVILSEAKDRYPIRDPYTKLANPLPPQSAIEFPAVEKNHLYYGDSLAVLREHIRDESVDFIYLDPPFNSRQDYNVLFAEKGPALSEAEGAPAPAPKSWPSRTPGSRTSTPSAPSAPSSATPT